MTTVQLEIDLNEYQLVYKESADGAIRLHSIVKRDEPLILLDELQLYYGPGPGLAE